MNNYKKICVYCGSSSKVDETYRKAARDLGKILSQNGLDLVYGGGHVGLMGIIADSVLESGGQVTGIIPRHIQEKEVAHETLTELHVVESMHERKKMMVDLSDGFVILPGGLGTMDEFFEIMTWRQLGLHQKPIVIVNINEYWSPLLSLIDNMVDNGFARADDRLYMHVREGVDEVVEALESAPRELISPNTKWM
jgi:uncharacterized protein (TIGR00730 family)